MVLQIVFGLVVVLLWALTIALVTFLITVYLWNEDARDKARNEPKSVVFCFLVVAVMVGLMTWGTPFVLREISPKSAPSQKTTEAYRVNPYVLDEQPRSKFRGEEEAYDLPLLRQEQESHLNDPALYEKKALELERDQRFEEALVSLDQAIELRKIMLKSPKSSPLIALSLREDLKKRAVLHDKLGEHEQEIKDYEELIEHYKKYGSESQIMGEFYSFHRAVALRKAKRWQEAIDELTRMIETGKPYSIDPRPCLELVKIYREAPDPGIRKVELAAKYEEMATERKAKLEEASRKFRYSDVESWEYPDSKYPKVFK